MLEKPDLPDEQLTGCLRHHYGLQILQVEFLPLGNDMNTAVYRVVDSAAQPYFLKLRSGDFDEITVAIPHLLSQQGMAQVIAPILTSAGRLWARMDAFAVMLFPFVEGKNGFEVEVTDHQRIEVGAALKRLHTAQVPEALRQRLPRETYSPYWRDLVRGFQARAEENAFAEPVAAQLAALLRAKRAIVDQLVVRAEQLAARLRTRSLEYVLCHADIHAANLLIDANGRLFIVDWDTLILAPKERDLMFFGSGIDNVWPSAREHALFYQGYGATEVNPIALAYYRYERIVE
ncbi:MAG TPA: aminoglycoside phosphotransferase family protein, partial [Gammaproteobacteria bacterium]|nr:aminoglycoside phosphotransferase family protein [Gammaproteobacteria bacterium]